MSGALVLETERLRLHAWGEDDGMRFAEVCNTPEVMRWLGGVLTPQKLAAAIERYTRWHDERGFTFWVLRRKSDEAWLGFCGLKLGDAVDSPVTGKMEIGWRLGEAAWGQGYAHEAATASLGYAFDRLDAPRVVAVTVPGNRPSWTLMERLGMIRAPGFDHADNRFGSDLTPAIVWAIDADKWATRSRPQPG